VYVDIVENGVSLDLLHLLGFKKVLIIGKDVNIGTKQAKNLLVALDLMGDSQAAKLIKSPMCIGAVSEFSRPIGEQVFKALGEDRKVFAISARAFIANELRLKHASFAFARAKRAKAVPIIASFAKRDLELFSPMQLIRLAMLLGADMPEAKSMLRWLDASKEKA